SCFSCCGYLECLSCLDDVVVATRGGRIYAYLEAGLVVPADVAPDDPAVGEQVMREKPLNNAGNHY
ncbi:MAG: hypothetical protein QW196_08240, partial [Sulfolobales archaeon]